MKITKKAFSLTSPSSKLSSPPLTLDKSKKSPAHTKRLSLLAALCLQAPLLCHALDVDPGDYTPLPDGTKLGLLYMQHAERKDQYINEKKVSDNAHFDTNIAILRAVRYQNIGEHVTNIQLLLPFGHIDTGGDVDALGSERGMGDPILAGVIFTKGSTQNRAFGITQYLYLPLGEYDKDSPINIGENRWKYVIQGGYMHTLTEKFVADIVADVTLFGDNNDFTSADLTLEQAPQYQLQGFLRYNLTERASFHVGYSRLWGGETKVDGVRMDDESNQEKLLAGGSYFVGPRTQVLATFGRDTSIDNGFREDSRINFRLMHIF
ncbi:transporter [Stutzerimonas stutzeri]|jgi:hypothetical protein|uniref:transporter n=1 Tax=Stutzerimonas stutzeri TaxID=316 RepID=UPI0026589F1F|nr:transporter [Stutzerimonas stutzeri]MCF6781375.1 transporter [Stutzerimonas stutzeri]MCF6806540.1 transporter [Stutzerimonas stutzeri]|tara:strand:+ start:664 stop:1626 length:963 start_codon:yes stop_codon:yes gene_type:complete